MCGPISMTVIAGLGALATAYSTQQQGKAQASQANYQAKVAERNAQQAQLLAEHERDASKENAAQQRRQTMQTLGTQRSLLAASGVDVTDLNSSALNILGDTAQWGEHDAQKILHQGEVKAWTYENQASQEQANSLLYKQGAKQASQAGAIGAGTSLLAGARQVANIWYEN